MKVELKTATRKKERVDRFGAAVEYIRPVVELSIGGFIFVHDCETLDQATKIVIRLSSELGLGK